MAHHIVFMAVPSHGHMRPALAVAEELVARGHRISVLATEAFAAAVRTVGADVVPYATHMAEWLEPHGDSLAWSRVLLFIENTHLVEKMAASFDDDPPDLIVYDMVVAPAGRALARRWNRPAIQSTPSFASHDRYSQIDVMLAAGGVGAGHPALVELRRIAGEFLVRHDLPESPESIIGWAAADALVYLPREFQISPEGCGPGTAFVGPCLGSLDRQGTWEPPDGDRPVVVVNGDFSREFADVQWHVVTTQTPQLAVVEHAAVFVTAGGLGSVTMALHQGVPMVVVPQIPECKVVARRVAALGLGIVVPPAEANGERLRDAVTGLLADEAIIGRVRRMRDRTRAAGGTTAAAELVEKLVSGYAG